MNLKPFLIGGIVAYFITKKSSSNKTTSTGNKSNVFIRPGYTITNCKTITINDKQKALKQAFKYGTTHGAPHDIDIYLFGSPECAQEIYIENNNVAKKFEYDLVLYYFSGALSLNKSTVEIITSYLEKMRIYAENIGIDTSQWLTEKDIPQIIEENK